jgi:hypothetical protein
MIPLLKHSCCLTTNSSSGLKKLRTAFDQHHVFTIRLFRLSFVEFITTKVFMIDQFFNDSLTYDMTCIKEEIAVQCGLDPTLAMDSIQAAVSALMSGDLIALYGCCCSIKLFQQSIDTTNLPQRLPLINFP